MDISVNGVSITLTDDQLKQIDQQVKKKSLKAIDRIKSVADAFEDQGLSLDKLKALEAATDPREIRANAHFMIEVVVDALNEGKKFTRGYYPYFNSDKDRNIVSFRITYFDLWHDDIVLLSARLAVYDSVTAEYLGKQFLELFKKANNTK